MTDDSSSPVSPQRNPLRDAAMEAMWFLQRCRYELTSDANEAQSVYYRLDEALEADDKANPKPVASSPVLAPAAHESRALQHLRELAADQKLRQKGWDSYDGAPLDDRAVQAAEKFLQYDWAVVPCPDGGIQIERHHSNCDIELNFTADGTLETISADLAAGLGRAPDAPSLGEIDEASRR